ncbi:hypothetical protein RAA17_01125 [Komagataeibacter rhaeticus]|nr:hypothetical protein [Komagataeibacter rhaeticus]
MVMLQMEMDPTLMIAVAQHARAHAIPVMLDPAPVPAGDCRTNCAGWPTS